MSDELRGKRVLITGATGGIGTAISRAFAEKGALIGVHYHSKKTPAELLCGEIVSRGGQAESFCADLLDCSAPRLLLKAFTDRFGGIDVLINNAGAGFVYANFVDFDPDSWRKTFDLNVRAPFYLIGAAFQHMQESSGGRVVNISSVNVKYGGSGKSMPYCASKAALDTLTVGFARAGAAHSILVNSIRCGLIETPMREHIVGYSEEQYQRRMELVPLKRAGNPDDIARMAVYLAGRGGNFITGEILTVAGGD